MYVFYMLFIITVAQKFREEFDSAKKKNADTLKSGATSSSSTATDNNTSTTSTSTTEESKSSDNTTAKTIDQADNTSANPEMLKQSEHKPVTDTQQYTSSQSLPEPTMSREPAEKATESSDKQ